MKERAVTMDADAVRATLAGLKTQMRVPVKLRAFGPSDTCGYDWTFRDRRGLWNDFTTAQLLSSKFCPVHVGDRLWVRETHAQFAVGNRTGWSPQCVACRATCSDDGSFDYVNNGDEVMRLKVTKWTSAASMPRWASRLTLEVTEVRLQRLQQITVEDAMAEGSRDWPDIPDSHPYGLGARWSMSTPASTDQCLLTARTAFANAWDRKHGKRCPWASNGWVWAYTYRRVS